MASSEDDASMEENFSLSTNFPDLMMSLLSRKLKNMSIFQRKDCAKNLKDKTMYI